MNILTWHGAVVRRDALRNRLVQDPIWLPSSEGEDFSFDARISVPVTTPLGVFGLETGSQPGTVRFSSPAGYLSAAPSRRELSCEPDEGHAWQSFMLLGPDDLADLRHILDHRWRLRPANMVLEKANIRLMTGFRLDLGPVKVNLPTSLPFLSYTRRASAGGLSYLPPPSFILHAGDEVAEAIEVADGAGLALAPAQQVELVARRQPPQEEVARREAFLAGANARLTIAGEPIYLASPLVLHGRDAALFERFVAASAAPVIGVVSQQFRVRREAGRLVCMSRGSEGLVFDQDGAFTDLGLLTDLVRLPGGFIRRDGRLWVQREAMNDAPRLEGPLLLFYDGRLDSYTSWLVGAMPALDAISRQVPRNTRLLLPAQLGRIARQPGTYDPPFEHREVMGLLGFNHLPWVQNTTELLRAEDLFFLESVAPADIPPRQLREFRDRVLQAHDGPGEATRRIYLKRAGAGGMEDRNPVERFLLERGFEPIDLEHVPVEKHIPLFRQAAFIVGPSGGAMANLVFGPPALRVLELMDNAQFAPDIWLLCAKLGVPYGFMGCKLVDERLEPDMAVFGALFAALEGYKL